MTRRPRRVLPLLSGRSLRCGVACAGAIATVAGLAAVVVLVGGLGQSIRHSLALPLTGWHRSPEAALEIAVHNARLALAVLFCAYLAPRVPSTARLGMDSLLVGVLAYNAALIGTTLGAYGMRLVALVALHLPLELVAMSLAGGAYISSRRAGVTAKALSSTGAYCLLLLLVAAGLETYTPLGGTP